MLYNPKQTQGFFESVTHVFTHTLTHDIFTIMTKSLFYLLTVDNIVSFRGFGLLDEWSDDVNI